jgi:hypothetical protein
MKKHIQVGKTTEMKKHIQVGKTTEIKKHIQVMKGRTILSFKTSQSKRATLYDCFNLQISNMNIILVILNNSRDEETYTSR